MKKTTLLQAQSSVDTMYDVDLQKEGFKGFPKFRGNKNPMYFFTLLLLILLFIQKKISGKIYILALASLILAITIWYR